MEILSQRDIRWKNIRIGSSNSTLGGYGCTLTCLAMLAGTTPDIINDKLNKAGGFSVDRIIWTSINNTDLPISFPDMGRYYSYDNDKVKKAISDNGGCLVEVDFDGIVLTPNDRHWILYVGGGKAHDPWTGTEIPTTKYPIVKGFCLINFIKPVINSNDNMTTEEANILNFLKDNNASEGKVREAFGALADIPKLTKQISDLTTAQGNLNIQIADLTQKVATIQKLADDWQTQLTTANKTGQKLSADLAYYQPYKALYEKALTDQVNKYTGWQLIRLGVNKLLLTVKK
jgi:hypothetical protein